MAKKIEIFDTHVHLNNDKMYAHAHDYVKKAIKENVTRMNVVGYNKETNNRAIKLLELDNSIVASVGFHPTEVKVINTYDYDNLVKQLNIEGVVALGEIGYDYYWDTTTKEEQTEAFTTQLDIAVQTKKPIVIHVRDAMNDTYEMVKKYANKLNGGILHCFSGSTEMAKKFIDLGFHISLAGPVTFKNAKVPKEVAKAIPLEWILTETDAPYLAPHPFRGKMNEPALVTLVVDEIAKIKNMEYEEVAKQTFENANKVFSLK